MLRVVGSHFLRIFQGKVSSESQSVVVGFKVGGEFRMGGTAAESTLEQILFIAQPADLQGSIDPLVFLGVRHELVIAMQPPDRHSLDAGDDHRIGGIGHHAKLISRKDAPDVFQLVRREQLFEHGTMPFREGMADAGAGMWMPLKNAHLDSIPRRAEILPAGGFASL